MRGAILEQQYSHPKLRSIYDREHAAFGKTPNRFGMIMTEAAYSGGREWLDQLMHYLEKNKSLFTTAMNCLLYTSPSPRDLYRSRMPSSA